MKCKRPEAPFKKATTYDSTKGNITITINGQPFIGVMEILTSNVDCDCNECVVREIMER